MLPQASTPHLATPDGLPSPHHTNALTRHLRHCRQANGAWFLAASWAERAHRQLAPRFVTTIAAAAVVLTLLCAWG